jgi:hypothetical protein
MGRKSGAAIYCCQIGEMSGPVVTDSGVHIILRTK